MSDVRALLLTDVVDSTRLAESIGDAAMAEVWTGHDRVARDLLQQHHGREIDKTDGMLMLFETAAQAAGYAAAYHRALASLPVPLKARAGLHVGPVILRENSAADVALGAKPLEVDGMAKPTAARVMSLAHGGQTLLTAEARADLNQTPFRVESHGHWMIKGVADPMEIFEACEADVRPVAPVDTEKVFRVVRAAEWWMPVRDIPHNLPHQATSFVGREVELEEVKGYLSKARLVTLLGMGGLGKTRLCLQAAAELIHQFPDGAWFLDLAPLRADELVVAAAAQVLGVREEPDRPLLRTLCAHLREKRALIIVDNCEHLLKASAELASAILQTAPNVRMLASSREALHVPGEQSYPLRPLQVPTQGASLSELSHSPAVRLFVDRARQHRPSFALAPTETAAIAELVLRLEGIPLALELAAARVRMLTVAEINSRLKDRYKILTGGARVLQERQQTLRALVDWSYDLLSEPEKRVFARLSVFVGGFDLSAAEVVCGADPLTPDDVLEILGSLVEKSLVMLETSDDGRYRILETIRDYAVERLARSDELSSTADRHCVHYFQRCKQARDGIQGPEQAEWIQRVELDLGNIRAAMALTLRGSVDPFIAVKIAVAMQTFWLLRGYATEARKFVREILELPAIRASDMAHAWALYVGAVLAETQSDHAEARQMLETCLELRRRLGDPVQIAATLSTLTPACLHAGDVDSAERAESEALALFRQAGDRRGEAISLIHLGEIAHYSGDRARARDHLEKCLVVAREVKHQETEGECLLALGSVELDAGDRPQAELWLKRSLTVYREAADKRGEANALRWLGRCDLDNGLLATARARLCEALQAFRTFEMWEELLGCVEDLAALVDREGAPETAVRLFAAADLGRTRRLLKRAPRGEIAWKSQIAQLRGRLTDAGFDAAWQDGRLYEIDESISIALGTSRAAVPA